MARYIHKLLNYNCSTSQKILFLIPNVSATIRQPSSVPLMKVAVWWQKRLVLKYFLASATVVVK